MKYNIPNGKVVPHVVFVIIAIVLSFMYFYPVIQGKVLYQNDVTKAMGMQKEMADYHKESGDYTLWTNSMFGGMPVYQIAMSNVPNYNIFHYLSVYIRLGLPKYSVDLLWLYFVGFYILLLSFGVNPWISIIGSIAFTFSSYNLIYIEAGHVNRALAISMIPFILSGVILTFKKKYFLGILLFCVFLGIQLAYNHLQMTYYTFLIILVYGAFELYKAIKSKRVAHLLVSVGILSLAAVFSVLPNITNIAMTYEYSKLSMRGGSELSEFSESGQKKDGLEKDYALAWSYGVAETFTILIPNFHGGSSAGEVSTKSNLYEALRNNNVPPAQAKQYIKQVPTYWGGKTVTSGPFYYGAGIVFLYFLGFFLINNTHKWWIITITALAILWSWGENLLGFNSLFFDYFPLFNKFRVPESFLVIPSVTFPLMAVLGIREYLNDDISEKKKIDALKYAFYVAGGLSIFFALFGGAFFDFQSDIDSVRMKGMPEWFMEALRADRAQLLKSDALRTLFFIGLVILLLWFKLKDKIKFEYFIALLSFIILVDLWSVDKRYLNKDDFVNKKQAREITPTQADLEILKDSDPNFRVFNLTISPFQETHTSYFHKSLGGYHGAKLSRYQDVIEHHLSKQNMKVINMLNTKYLIVPDENKMPTPRFNPNALGNAWFVKGVRWEEDPKGEINALNDFEPELTAIVNKKYDDYLSNNILPENPDSLARIQLTEYKPDHLTYQSSSSTGGFVVYSEIYYNDKKGWKAYIDGVNVPHIQVNYILRGMYVPSGEHKIEFKFEPQTFYWTQNVSIGSSLVIVLAILILLGLSFKKSLEPPIPKGE